MIYEICENYSVLKTFALLINIFNVLKIVIPLVLIVMVMMDFFKAVTANDQKAISKASMGAVRRLIAASVIFFIPSLVNLFINILDESVTTNVNLAACINNSQDLDRFKELNDEAKAKVSATEEEKRQEEIARLRELAGNRLKLMARYNPLTTSDGSSVGKSYNISNNSELTVLTAIAKKEQPGTEGLKAEVSLMMNLYEKHSSSYPNIYTYVCQSGWFSHASDYCNYSSSNLSKVTDEERSVVKQVLAGQRTLPYYIDEHDMKGDILSLTNSNKTITGNGIKNNFNYHKDETRVHTRYHDPGEYWIFYTFPCTSCDPFGYTPGYKRKIDSAKVSSSNGSTNYSIN